MKILIVGDQHFRYELPYSTAIQDGRRQEWEATKKTIHDAAMACDEVVLLGDGFNSRHNHSSVIREFVDFLKGFGDKKIHILVGNHERYSESTALDFLAHLQHKNWFIYTTPQLVEVAGEKAMMIPYMTPALLDVQTREEGAQKLVSMFPEGKTPLAFIHHGITGALVYGIVADLFNEIVLPQEALIKSFNNTFAGHIHALQIIPPNIIITGSIFTSMTGDAGKCVWTYEYENSKSDSQGSQENGRQEPKAGIKKIDLPVRGIYKSVYEKTGKDGSIPKNSIVKCFVTSKETDIEDVKDWLKSFDAGILIEDYPNERKKISYQENGESGTLDMSVENLLQMWAENKGLSYADIKAGFDLIKQQI